MEENRKKQMGKREPLSCDVVPAKGSADALGSSGSGEALHCWNVGLGLYTPCQSVARCGLLLEGGMALSEAVFFSQGNSGQLGAVFWGHSQQLGAISSSFLRQHLGGTS